MSFTSPELLFTDELNKEENKSEEMENNNNLLD